MRCDPFGFLTRQVHKVWHVRESVLHILSGMCLREWRTIVPLANKSVGMQICPRHQNATRPYAMLKWNIRIKFCSQFGFKNIWLVFFSVNDKLSLMACRFRGRLVCKANNPVGIYSCPYLFCFATVLLSRRASIMVVFWIRQCIKPN